MDYRVQESQDRHRYVAHHGGVSEYDEEPTTALPEEQPAAERPRQRWRDRAWSLRALIAVALASVILGGLAGAALANIGDHQDQHRSPGFGRRFGPGMPPPGRHGFGQGPRWRFHDPYGQGQRQWGQGPGQRGPLTPNSTPTPRTPTPSG